MVGRDVVLVPQSQCEGATICKCATIGGWKMSTDEDAKRRMAEIAIAKQRQAEAEKAETLRRLRIDLANQEADRKRELARDLAKLDDRYK